MDNIDIVAVDENDTIAEETNRFLQTVVKLEEFNKEDINKPKSKLCRLFYLKYKCILIISALSTALLTFGASLLSMSMSASNMNSKTNYTEIVNNYTNIVNSYTEIVNLLISLFNVTKTQ